MTRLGYLLWLLLAAALIASLVLLVSLRLEQRNARLENAALLANIVRQADLATIMTRVKDLEAQVNGLADGFDIHMRQAGRFQADAALELRDIRELSAANICMAAQDLEFWLIMTQSDGAPTTEIAQFFTGRSGLCAQARGTQ